VITGIYLGSFIADISQIVIGALILPICIWLVNRPRPYLAAFIYALIVSGTYTVHVSLFDVGIVMTAGLVGYFMRYFGFPFLPAILGVILGGLIESNYRRSLVLSGGDMTIFFEDPIAIVFLVLAALMVTAALANEWRNAIAARKAIAG
jgi:putative tricarboxylic transport membrane protein